MMNFSQISQRAFAALGAVAITAGMLFSSFATPHTYAALGVIVA